MSYLFHACLSEHHRQSNVQCLGAPFDPRAGQDWWRMARLAGGRRDADACGFDLAWEAWEGGATLMVM